MILVWHSLRTGPTAPQIVVDLVGRPGYVCAAIWTGIHHRVRYATKPLVNVNISVSTNALRCPFIEEELRVSRGSIDDALT